MWPGARSMTSAQACLAEVPALESAIVGVFLIAADFISYYPQHRKILKYKSTQGVSATAILLGLIGSYSTLLNALSLQWDQLDCCTTLPFLQCQVVLLSVYQLSAGLINLVMLVVWFWWYFPRRESPREWSLFCGQLIAFFGLWIVLGTAICLSLLRVGGSTSTAVRGYAYFLSVIAMMVDFIHWAPQIYLTYKSKATGQLSIITLMIQVPGAFLVIYFQASLYGESVSTWISYLSSGLQQAILLVMCFYYATTIPASGDKSWWVLIRNTTVSELKDMLPAPPSAAVPIEMHMLLEPDVEEEIKSG